MTIPIDPNEALVVTGALTWKAADRSLARDELAPVQVLTSDGIRPAPAFDRGEFGVSCLVFRPDAGVVYGSSGDDFFKFDLASGGFTDIAIPDLKDVHEVNEIDGSLWIANTGRDEVIVLDLATESVTRRVSVASVRKQEPGPETAPLAGGDETVDRFHANQVVRALDGSLYVLVHHVDGKQVLKLVAKRLIKMQGNGGVIQLETGRGFPLSLNGPHSIQVVSPDEQWICDSRAGVLRVYDAQWREQAQIPCSGWGRGVTVSERTGLAYVGISAIRKRYLQVIPSSQHSQNMIEAFDIAKREPAGEQILDHVEQVNNVYCVSREVAESLLRA